MSITDENENTEAILANFLDWLSSQGIRVTDAEGRWPGGVTLVKRYLKEAKQ